jgi:hypothetical protein
VTLLYPTHPTSSCLFVLFDCCVSGIIVHLLKMHIVIKLQIAKVESTRGSSRCGSLLTAAAAVVVSSCSSGSTSATSLLVAFQPLFQFPCLIRADSRCW